MSSRILIGKEAPFSAALYAEAFGGTEEEARADLDALRRADARPFSLSREGEVLSQGIGIPFWADGAKPVLYLYALATAAPARGQGLMRTLLREVAERYGESTYSCLCLLPASEALTAAYGRMGFSERRPAGGAAALRAEDDFSLRFGSLPDFEPCSLEEMRAPLGMALSRELFAYAATSLGDRVMPTRIKAPFGYEYALLYRDDPHLALAVTDGLKDSVTRQGAHDFLLLPLRRELPASIPEPLPR